MIDSGKRLLLSGLNLLVCRGGLEEEVVVAQETRSAAKQNSPAHVRAREVEEQMTNDERE